MGSGLGRDDHERDHHLRCVVEDLPARNPPFDRLGGPAVGGQIGAPGGFHAVQQADSPIAAGEPDEPDRMGVVRRGRGERLGDRLLDDLRRHRLGGEAAHRAAQQLGLPASQPDRLVGAQPEQVVGAGAHQRRGRRAVVGRPQSAHHRHRHTGQLALHQVGRRGDLVGDGHLGHQQFVAVAVARPGVAVQHRHPGRADGGVGLPGAPRPTHGVGDQHGDVHTRPPTQGGAQPRGAGVRIQRQQREFGGVDVGSVHSGSGLHQTLAVLGDQGAALACQHAHGFVVDQPSAQGVALLRVGRCGDHAPLALGHDLAGDHHHVAVAQPRRRVGDGRGEVVAGPELAESGDRQDLDRRGRAVLAHSRTPAASKPARTICAVCAGSVISSGTAVTVTPGTCALSFSCTSQWSSSPVSVRAPSLRAP